MQLTDIAYWGVIFFLVLFAISKISKLFGRRLPHWITSMSEIFDRISQPPSGQVKVLRPVRYDASQIRPVRYDLEEIPSKSTFDAGSWGLDVQKTWEAAEKENEGFARRLFEPESKHPLHKIQDIEYEEKEPKRSIISNEKTWEKTLDENEKFVNNFFGADKDEESDEESDEDEEDPWDTMAQESNSFAEKFIESDEESAEDYDFEEPWLKASKEDKKFVDSFFGWDESDDE